MKMNNKVRVNYDFYTTKVMPDNSISRLQTSRIVREVISINILVLFVLFISKSSSSLAFLFGLCIIFYLSLISIIKPIKGFFIIFGVKLTFDALWFLKRDLSIFGNFGLLELFIIPICLLLLFGPKMNRRTVHWPLFFSAIYLIWTILVTILNGYNPEIELIVRQSCMFLGFFLGFKFIKNRDHLILLIQVVFISTIIPLLALIIQFCASLFEISFLYFKLDSLRHLRFSGLYYDAGTAGMVSIISLVSNSYLLYAGLIKQRFRKYYYILIGFSCLGIVIGGTRSMAVVALFILVFLLAKNVRQTMRIVPVIFIVLFIGQTYINNMMSKSQLEIWKYLSTKPVSPLELIQETDFRTMLTGRVGIWQDVWKTFKSGSSIQNLFGAGITSNAHSSYFFLLLQIGWLGLIFYFIFHIRLITTFFINIIPRTEKFIAILLLISLMLIGISLSVVIYTSFQWIIYFVIGGVLNLSTTKRRTEALNYSNTKSLSNSI
jgi:hypothetical protein